MRRWSTRKAAARKTVETPTTNAVAKRAEPEPVLTDADMPPLESLTPDSDFRPFLSPGVSEELRRTALRRLFRSPAYNTLCPLEGEYFEGTGYQPLGSIVTHEMRSQLAREAERLNARAQDVVTSTLAGVSDSSDVAADVPATVVAKPAQPKSKNRRMRSSKRDRRVQARKA